jgi:hypothetical protein
VGSGAVNVTTAERSELELLLSGVAPVAMLNLPPTASPDQIRSAALQGITKWRTAAGDPLADPTYIEVCDVAARTLEQIYATAG